MDDPVSTAPGNYNFNAALADEEGIYPLIPDIAAVIERGDVITLSARSGARNDSLPELVPFLPAMILEGPSPPLPRRKRSAAAFQACYTRISIGCPARASLPEDPWLLEDAADWPDPDTGD